MMSPFHVSPITVLSSTRVRWPFTSGMLMGYLLFIAAILFGRAINAVGDIGEIGDMLTMLAIAWPYPLMLALQTWIPIGSSSSAFTFLGGGLVVIYGTGRLVEWKKKPRPTWWMWVGSVAWLLPLSLVQWGIFIYVAKVLHLPVGE